MKALVDAVVVKDSKMIYICNYEIEISDKYEILESLDTNGDWDADLDRSLVKDVKEILLNEEFTDVDTIIWIGTKTGALHESLFSH